MKQRRRLVSGLGSIAVVSALIAGCSAGGNAGGDGGNGDGAGGDGSPRNDGASTGDGAGGGDGSVVRDGNGGMDGTSGNDGGRGDGASVGDGAGGDASCGSASFPVRPVPPNVLVLLDRSCSMRRTPEGTLLSGPGTGTSKWEIAVAALNDLTTSYAAQVHWGLIYLPRSGTVDEGATCGGTPVCGGTTTCPEVAPGPGNGPAVQTVLGQISPFDGCDTGQQQHITPLNDALMAAAMVPQLHDVVRTDVVLLVTDGQESCLTGDSTMDSMTLATSVTNLASMNIKTAVVGFGTTGGTDGVDPVELNAMASAGGLPASGATQYYAAADEASLHAAFDTIIASTLSCSFTLTTPPADPSSLRVYINASPTALPRDPTHADGWDYDTVTNVVTLYGSSCDDVHQGRLTQLDVLATCPGQPPPPPPGACHTMGQSCTTDTDCCGVQGLVCDTDLHQCQFVPG